MNAPDENGNSLKIPGWFVRLNLVVLPFLVTPLVSWLIYKAQSNSDRIQQLEANDRHKQQQLDALDRLATSVSDEQRRRTERVYPSDK